ncbi:MAG: DUF3515 domain-containing protein [Pseudonocardiaceae bacterium]
MPPEGRSGPPRWLLGTTIAIPAVLVVGVVLAAAVIRGQAPGPLVLPPAPAPQAGSPDCRALLSALPERIDAGAAGELRRRPIREPAPPGAAAWGQPPTVLRCGLGRPAELTASSRLLAVSGVQFLEIPGPGATRWVVVDRPVYVAVTLPDGVGSAPLQQVATAVRGTLPRTDVAP